MSQHGFIRRYSLILEKIGRRKYPSFNEIKAYLLEHGFEVSARTIQRDIEQIRFEFDIEIKYKHHKKGYYIDEENSLNTDAFIRFLSIVATADLLTESLRESKDTLNYIAFESQGDLRGIEHLRHLLFAIKYKRKISFVYQRFEAEEQKKISILPYILREYQSRWYVLGIFDKGGSLYTFGIDRIQNLEVSEEIFRPDLNINSKELFAHIIGVTYTAEKVEKVVLSFTPRQGQYIKTLPLHTSQEILTDNEKELRISLEVALNYELLQKILMYGDSVQIIEPKDLVDKIKHILKASLKNYDTE